MGRGNGFQRALLSMWTTGRENEMRLGAYGRRFLRDRSNENGFDPDLNIVYRISISLTVDDSTRQCYFDGGYIQCRDIPQESR